MVEATEQPLTLLCKFYKQILENSKKNVLLKVTTAAEKWKMSVTTLSLRRRE